MFPAFQNILVLERISSVKGNLYMEEKKKLITNTV